MRALRVEEKDVCVKALPSALMNNGWLRWKFLPFLSFNVGRFGKLEAKRK
jgi:hypothetical protein